MFALASVRSAEWKKEGREKEWRLLRTEKGRKLNICSEGRKGKSGSFSEAAFQVLFPAGK